ncbi:MAG: NUDIX hydrolase [Clostridia bacterium]|nr:NUDIX hydrolase [Clostridia bacterium]
MELWDAYDRDFNRIEGVTLVRGEPVPEGMYHMVCEVLVRHADGEYLLMQRDRRKPYGGMWEASAGGSALRGETPEDCARRELREETGIAADGLTEIARVVSPETRSIYVEFLCVTNCAKDAITLQEGETIAWRWTGREALLGMRDDDLLGKRMKRYIEGLRE